MLGTVLDRITRLFGRAFFIGAFFPVVLFVATHVTLSGFHLGWQETGAWWKGAFENKALAGLLLLVGVTASAYLVMIVSPMLKRVLEGRYELGRLTEPMRRRKKARFIAAEKNADNDREEVVRRTRHYEQLHGRLVAAFQRRQASQSPVRADIRLDACLADLERKLARLRGKGLVDAQELEDCAGQIVQLYDGGADPKRLEKPHRRLEKVLQDVVHTAEQRYAESLMDFSSRFARSSGSVGVCITTLGNIMSATRSYPYDRYCIDPVATWPPLQTVIPKEYFPTVEDARVSYDFAVVCTYLSALVAASWAGVMVWDLATAWPVLEWVGWAPISAVVGGALGTLVFRALAIEAARSFGAVFRTCFDLYRFELLKKLSLPLPANLAEERALWEKVNQLLVHADWSQDLGYAHDGKPAVGKAVAPAAATAGKAPGEKEEEGFVGRLVGLFGGG
ncbi:MAG: hypothetical protein ACQGVK_06450 [Myxococcota bacterium]